MWESGVGTYGGMAWDSESDLLVSVCANLCAFARLEESCFATPRWFSSGSLQLGTSRVFERVSRVQHTVLAERRTVELHSDREAG